MRTPLCAVVGLLVVAIVPVESAQKRVILRDHPRLRRTITLEESRIELGALFDRLSDNDIRIEADDRMTPVSGYRVTLVMKNQPVWRVLESITRVYTTKSDPWYWTSERGSPAKLVLHNTLTPVGFRAARQEFVDEFCLAQRRRRREFYALPKEKRSEAAAKDPQLAAGNSPRSEMFFSFHARFSDNEIRDILHGRQVDIPTNKLTDAQRQFIRNEYAMARVQVSDEVGPPESLEKVTLFSTPNDDVPSLFLNLGAVGAHAVAGGVWMQEAMRDATHSEWIGKGESREAESISIPVAGEKVSPGDFRIGRTREETLIRLARLAHIDLVYDQATGGRIGSDQTLAGELPRVLEHLIPFGMMWKRWDTTYLLRYADRELARRDFYVPWPILKSIRTTADGHGGYLKGEDWVRLSLLMPEQLERLQDEFPDALEIQRHRNLLLLAGSLSSDEREALNNPTGAGWDDWSSKTRARLVMGLGRERAHAFRAHLRFESDKQPPQMRIWAVDGQTRLPLTVVPFAKRKAEASMNQAS